MQTNTTRAARSPFAGAVALALAVAAAACGGDDGEPTPVASPASSPTAAATARPTAAGTEDVPAITIDAPAEGSTVAIPLAASGTANTFEAMLAVDVLNSAGDVLCRHSVMATSGTGTRGTWETTLAFPPPDAPIEATFRAFEFSAKDGSIINLVERAITVSAERPNIFITEPACNDAVAPGATLAVRGRGVAFEATINLQLRDASGAAVVEGMTMGGATEEADFSAELAIPATLPQGLYDLVAFNYSPRDGAIENEFGVPLSVQAP